MMRSYALARGHWSAAALLLMLAASIAAAPRSASGQEPLTPLGIPWAGLNVDDIARMNAAAARLYGGHAIGTVERWRNPDTQDAGSVILQQHYEAGGMPCLRMEYTIRFQNAKQPPSHYAVSWCKAADDQWKMAAPRTAS